MLALGWRSLHGLVVALVAQARDQRNGNGANPYASDDSGNGQVRGIAHRDDSGKNGCKAQQVHHDRPIDAGFSIILAHVPATRAEERAEQLGGLIRAYTRADRELMVEARV